MIYSKEYNFLFIHIHKSAGGSIQKAFRDRLKLIPDKVGERTFRNHATYSEVVAEAPEVHDVVKFSVVRNPYDRLVSVFHWIRQNPNIAAHRHFMNFRSFVDFVDRLYNEGYVKSGPEVFRTTINWKGASDGASALSYVDQAYYLTDKTGSLQMDELVRFENLSEDFFEICNKLGIAKIKKLPIIHKSNHAPFVDYYTNQETSDKVFEMYERDFNLFGYSKINVQ